MGERLPGAGQRREPCGLLGRAGFQLPDVEVHARQDQWPQDHGQDREHGRLGQAGVAVMDPNETLKRIRGFINDGDSADVELIEAFEALDNWLCHGGFLPKDWAR